MTACARTGEATSSTGPLQSWLWQTEVFGLHAARLDIRQVSDRNGRVAAELLRALGRAEDYSSLPREKKRELLHAAMSFDGVPPEKGLSADARETLGVFAMLGKAARTLGEEALGGHIVSMTHALSDVLAALWLMRLHDRAGAGGPAMGIVPLFETIQDLEHAPGIVRDMLDDPEYRRHLARRGNVQTVMIGYSDCTKDGGYLTARSILALPPESLGAGLRMTEQGEVLAGRYYDPQIAGRHLEQVIWATLAASTQPLSSPKAEWRDAMQELAREAFAAYRGLIDASGFLTFFDQATPIVEIESLPIAFRPAHRHGIRSLGDLRAIPWVFAWTQNRCMIPAWYGIGAAFQAFTRAHPEGWRTLQEMYAGWPFFRATLDNAVLALARTDLEIGRMYADLVDDEEGRVRNPNTGPLNLIQVEWLRRLREAGDRLRGPFRPPACHFHSPGFGVHWRQKKIGDRHGR